MARLEGKVALLVGAYAPHGARDVDGAVSNEWALALACAEAGAAVVVADRDLAAAEEVAAALADRGHRAAALACEVTDAPSCAAAVAEAQRMFGALHLLVNTVGEPDMKTIDGLDGAEFDQLMRSHLLGNFLLMKAALPAIARAGGGAVVTISSLSAIRTGGAGIAYETAKAGLLAMTRNVALSAAPEGIRVNAVLPGALDSAAFRQFAGPAAAAFAERVPLGRLGAPADLANAVVFLLSDDAAFVTGGGLLVDGGMAWRI